MDEVFIGSPSNLSNNNQPKHDYDISENNLHNNDLNVHSATSEDNSGLEKNHKVTENKFTYGKVTEDKAPVYPPDDPMSYFNEKPQEQPSKMSFTTAARKKFFGVQEDLWRKNDGYEPFGHESKSSNFKYDLIILLFIIIFLSILVYFYGRKIGKVFKGFFVQF